MFLIVFFNGIIGFYKIFLFLNFHIVSLVELLHYIQRKKDSLEVEKELDEVVVNNKSSAAATPTTSTSNTSSSH